MQCPIPALSRPFALLLFRLAGTTSTPGARSTKGSQGENIAHEAAQLLDVLEGPTDALAREPVERPGDEIIELAAAGGCEHGLELFAIGALVLRR